MEPNAANVQNQGYWFVVRDDQTNVYVLRDERDNDVLFSSDNVPAQTSQTAEIRYTNPNDNGQYLQIGEPTVGVQVEEVEPSAKVIKEEFWDKNKVKLLLSLCLEDRFSVNSSDKDTALWHEIAVLVGTTPESCSKKYRNLKRTYIRLIKNKRLGKEVKWTHFSLCEEIFKYYKTPRSSMLEVWEDSKIRRLLTLYIENISRFRSTEYVKKDIWSEIANSLGKTESSCYHKFKNLKRTYFSWLEKNRDGRSLKWPYHQYFDRIFYNYNPNIGKWNSQKVKKLLDEYAQVAYKFNRPTFQKKELWNQIAISVGESASICDRKFRNLKQTYIKLKYKSGNKNVIKWRYYKDFESIFAYGNESCMDAPYVSRLQEEDYVRQLLTFYIENKDKFRDPSIKNKSLWKIIGEKINLSYDECDKKFRNLKQTFMRLFEKKQDTGESNNWPYYSYFEIIYNDLSTRRVNDTDTGLSEIKNIVKEVEERREDNRRFEKLIQMAEESNRIQRERNKILQALLDRRK